MRDEYIFQYDLAEFKVDSLSDALQRVRELSDGELSDPLLPEKLERIANEICFDIAALAASPQKGKRRKEKSKYGRHEEFEEEYDVVDVFIHFQGSSKSFKIKHPDGEEVDVPTRIDESTLIATFGDDEHLKQSVHEYIELVTANLSLLRTALKPFLAELRSAIHTEAEGRREGLIRRRTRDRDLGFPIE
jgi:hypothetical protein